jgi:hypothetical protein
MEIKTAREREKVRERERERERERDRDRERERERENLDFSRDGLRNLAPYILALRQH